MRQEFFWHSFVRLSIDSGKGSSYFNSRQVYSLHYCLYQNFIVLEDLFKYLSRKTPFDNRIRIMKKQFDSFSFQVSFIKTNRARGSKENKDHITLDTKDNSRSNFVLHIHIFLINSIANKSVCVSYSSQTPKSNELNF